MLNILTKLVNTLTVTMVQEESSSHTSSPAYINTKQVVEQTAASSLGNTFYCFPSFSILFCYGSGRCIWINI